jgi:hypothetical protein
MAPLSFSPWSLVGWLILQRVNRRIEHARLTEICHALHVRNEVPSLRRAIGKILTSLTVDARSLTNSATSSTETLLGFDRSHLGFL